MVLFFLRAHNDRAALVLPTFQLLGHSKYPASTAFPALVHPESSCSAFDAIECEKTQNGPGNGFFTCSCHSGTLEAKRGQAYRI